mgnify:FL=1|jgi:hypothetical protein|tara:strand:- start:40 stop:456 length:417 start_codon:yes stop_codon:yes gene_type:complete
MSKKDNVSKIKSYIEDVLGAKGNLRDKLPAKISYKRDLFCQVLQNLQFVNGRTLGMKHDYKVNFMDYDDPFYVALENLLKLHYTQEQRNLINWWLYEKYLPSGEVLILTDKETEEIIPSDTPEDIWNLMQEHEKKDNK